MKEYSPYQNIELSHTTTKILGKLCAVHFCISIHLCKNPFKYSD